MRLTLRFGAGRTCEGEDLGVKKDVNGGRHGEREDRWVRVVGKGAGEMNAIFMGS